MGWRNFPLSPAERQARDEYAARVRAHMQIEHGWDKASLRAGVTTMEAWHDVHASNCRDFPKKE